MGGRRPHAATETSDVKRRAAMPTRRSTIVRRWAWDGQPRTRA